MMATTFPYSSVMYPYLTQSDGTRNTNGFFRCLPRWGGIGAPFDAGTCAIVMAPPDSVALMWTSSTFARRYDGVFVLTGIYD